MKRNEIIKKVDELIELNSNSKQEEKMKREIEVLTELKNNNDGFLSKSIEKIDRKDLFAALYYVEAKNNGTDVDLEDIINMSIDFYDLYEKDESLLEKFIEIAYQATNNDDMDFDIEKLEKVLNKDSMSSRLLEILNSIRHNDEIYLMLELLKETIDISNEEFINTFKLMSMDSEAFAKAYSIQLAQYEMLDHQKKIDEMEKEAELILGKIRNKDKETVRKKEMESAFNYKEIRNVLSKISNYLETIKKEYKSVCKLKGRRIDQLNKFKILFEVAITRDEISNYEELSKLIYDDELRLEVLKYIYNHNQDEYERIETEKEKFSADTRIKYQALLNSLKINKGDYNIEIIMDKTLEECEKIIGVLKYMNIKEQSIYVYVLENISLEEVLFIKSYYDQGYINSSNITKNITIFDSNDQLHKNFIKSVEEVNKLGLNPRLFAKKDNILFNEYILIIKNLKILADYNLINNIKFSEEFNYLKMNNLDEILDNLIELGLYNFIKEDINLLNIIDIKKLLILKGIGYKVEDKEELYKVLQNNLLIKEEGIDSYLYDDIPNYEEYLTDSGKTYYNEEYDKAFMTIDIDGVTLSTNRIKRNMKNLKFKDISDEEKEIIILTKGSILDESELKEIENYVRGTYEK